MGNVHNPLGRALMIQGTSSNVGKSVLTAAFCRIFYQEGYRICPFKAQNMALNSFVTTAGGEMGRAQVVQAQAAGMEPDVRMNPVLLKPTGQAGSQVVLMGKAQGNFSAMRYHGEYQQKAWPVVAKALQELLEENDLLIIEGAGSPAEVNLKANDIVNMKVATEFNIPVLLVADIDRGGALASVVGTLELIEPRERNLVKGIIMNKFRGDIKLLQPALDFLEEKTGIPVVGVIPYYTDFTIPEEDSVVLEQDSHRPAFDNNLKDYPAESKLDIVVLRLPYISNFTDFDALQEEEDVCLRYVNKLQDLGRPDLIIIPGSKNTLSDFDFLNRSGIASRLKELGQEEIPIIGICGGYQMMGQVIRDPLHTESSLGERPGLGLLPLETEFYPEKKTVQTRGKVIGDRAFLSKCQGAVVEGYEIHMGKSTILGEHPQLFELGEGSLGEEEGDFGEDNNGRGNRNLGNARYCDGLARGTAFGTYLHGLFDNDELRRALLEWLWERRGLERPVTSHSSYAALRETAFNKLAALVRQNVDMKRIRSLIGLG